jgi:hypothetical protein
MTRLYRSTYFYVRFWLIFIDGFKDLLIMLDTPQQQAEKAKVIKKLMSKWLKDQETVSKATLLLSKNPEIKLTGIGRLPKKK